MCLSDIARIVEMDKSHTWAIVEDNGTRRRISLAVLVVDGTVCRPGDWVVVHTGLAVERIEHEEAVSVVAVREGLAATTEGRFQP